MGMHEQDQNNEKAIELGRWLFSQNCTFLIGAVKMDDLPEGSQTEIAFAGSSESTSGRTNDVGLLQQFIEEIPTAGVTGGF